MTKRCLIMAGGTGGHVFPALAVAHALQEAGWHIEWLGTAERMEADVVPQHGFTLHFLPVKGLRGKGPTEGLKGLWALAESLVKAKQLITRIQPDLVIGFGGYASGPGGVAARLARVPLIIHEQNAAAGMTNKLLGRIAHRILLGFKEAAAQFGDAEKKCVVVGNPIRNEIRTLNAKASVHSPLRVLVIGGSLGSLPLNNQVPLALLPYDQVDVWHQSGKGHKAALTEAYSQARCTWKVTEFIDDMAHAYDWADVIICRAGALTVAEVAAAGLSAVFVPLPHAVDDHQTKNAAALVNAQAATLIPQDKLANELPDVIAHWIAHPQQCLARGKKARELAIIDATEQVVNQCAKLVGDTA